MQLADQLLAIGLVLFLLGAAIAMFGRKRGGLAWPGFGRGPARQTLVSCLARMPLTAQHMLHLVKVGDRTILIATYPGGVSIDSRSSSFHLSFADALEQEDSK